MPWDPQGELAGPVHVFLYFLFFTSKTLPPLSLVRFCAAKTKSLGGLALQSEFVHTKVTHRPLRKLRIGGSKGDRGKQGSGLADAMGWSMRALSVNKRLAGLAQTG